MFVEFLEMIGRVADIKFKEQYLKSKKEEIVIIRSPVGLPGRAIKNKFLEEVEAGTQ